MTNQTSLAKGGTSGVAGETIAVRRWEHEIDIASATGTVTTGGYTVVVNIPVDTYFTVEQVEMITAASLDAGASGRISVGDSGSATVFVNAASTFTAGTNLTIASRTGNASNGAVYTSADTLRLTLTGDKLAGGTADATGKIRFVGTIMSAVRNAPMTVQS